MNDNAIYERLRNELDKMPVGVPQSSNGIEIKILKKLFTPQQAQLALHLNIIPEPLEIIYTRAGKSKSGLTKEEFQQQLDEMTTKGLLLRKTKHERHFYSYALFAIGMYEFQVDRLNKDFYQDCEEYLEDAFAEEFFREKSPQIRPVPIEASISSETSISPYDDVYSIMDSIQGDYAVVNCVCRQGKDLIGESCSKTNIRETCVVFPGASQNYFNMGLGRKIDRQEAVSIIKRAEEDGLVLQMGNAQENPMVVCCCCGDCCGVLQMAKQFPRPSELVSSNYYMTVDSRLCKSCQKCITRCHMEAITYQDKTIGINRDRCIGCGACVPVCSFGALELKKKNNPYVPPKRTGEYYRKLLFSKNSFWGKMKIIIKLLFKKKV